MGHSVIMLSGNVATGLSKVEALRLMAQQRVTEVICQARGWDPRRLTVTQIAEIQATDEWKRASEEGEDA